MGIACITNKVAIRLDNPYFSCMEARAAVAHRDTVNFLTPTTIVLF